MAIKLTALSLSLEIYAPLMAVILSECTNSYCVTYYNHPTGSSLGDYDIAKYRLGGTHFLMLACFSFARDELACVEKRKDAIWAGRSFSRHC